MLGIYVHVPFCSSRCSYCDFATAPYDERSAARYLAALEEELERMLSGCQATVVAGGHTHTQMLRRFREMTVINPGSVGLTIERSSLTGEVRNPPWAEYAVVGLEKGELWIEFRRVPYDVGELIQAARESGMLHTEWWINHWITQ